jgi:hypothetical protein
MFVVYLSSKYEVNELLNAYGYYTGKCYTKDGEVFPVTDNQITERTKQYTSRIRAARGADTLIEKCTYVLSYKVEEI